LVGLYYETKLGLFMLGVIHFKAALFVHAYVLVLFTLH
jgi:hypothetical protein